MTTSGWGEWGFVIARPGKDLPVPGRNWSLHPDPAYRFLNQGVGHRHNYLPPTAQLLPRHNH